MSVQIAKRPFTADEYERMIEAAILTEDDRVELIEGEIVEMSPIGHPHAGCVNRLTQLFSSRSAGAYVVAVQNPVRLGDYSEPQPDIALLRRRGDFYEGSLPTPSEVLLIVEVADTSYDYDRYVKLPLHARSGVAEVWLVDLSRGAVEVFAGPVGDQYQSSRVISPGESFAPQGIPQLSVTVGDILG